MKTEKVKSDRVDGANTECRSERSNLKKKKKDKLNTFPKKTENQIKCQQNLFTSLRFFSKWQRKEKKVQSDS